MSAGRSAAPWTADIALRHCPAAAMMSFEIAQHHVVTDCGALDALKSVAHLACQLLQAGQNIRQMIPRP